MHNKQNGPCRAGSRGRALEAAPTPGQIGGQDFHRRRQARGEAFTPKPKNQRTAQLRLAANSRHSVENSVLYTTAGWFRVRMSVV